MAKLLAGIEKDEFFILSVVSLAKQWNIVEQLSDVIEECEIDNKYDLYEILMADCDE